MKKEATARNLHWENAGSVASFLGWEMLFSLIGLSANS